MKKSTHRAIMLFCFLYYLINPSTIHTQVVYAVGSDLPYTGYYLIRIDLSSCTWCRVSPLGLTGYSALAVLPNGNLIVTGSVDLKVYDPPAPAPVASLNVFAQGQVPAGVVVSPGGQVYISGTAGLGLYNPVTNTYTPIGPWPAGIPIVLDMFYWNGQLYGFTFVGGQWQLLAIDPVNPAASVLSTVINGLGVIQGGGAIAGSGIYVVGNSNTIYELDISTGDPVLLCNFTGQLEIEGLSTFPAGAPEPGCLCTTDAGTVTSGTTNYCINTDAVVPVNNNEVLENDDVLQFILFSNPGDTLGSIIATSNTPVFSFNPLTMLTGVTYYVAAIAGNDLGNGNADLTDDCLDISNAAIIIWRPLPSVTFSVGNPNVCAGDCRAINVNFTGSPPYTITGDISAGGVPVGTFTQNYPGNSGVLNICVPAGVSPGALEIQVTSLIDNWCTCGP